MEAWILETTSECCVMDVWSHVAVQFVAQDREQACLSHLHRGRERRRRRDRRASLHLRPATRGGDAPDGRRVKATMHWVSAAHAVPVEVRLYDRLFSVEDPKARPTEKHFSTT